ncbi:hypothetical protein [Pedobacter aquatilis]|uniref:hypothetical protein n=1 Tax=Pedobacter aquatilis TaxID=351343 RepID=UPI00292F250A|nr:hypothetical protein [Pedobacter aquatilis]
MADDIITIRRKFDALLHKVKGKPTAEFTKMTEMGFEALVCVETINEYARIHGMPRSIDNPAIFLNQKPGRFNPGKAFRVEFGTETYFFATDVECFGLVASQQRRAIGDVFEADVVVIHERHVNEILRDYGGYPAPHHLEAAYECKFGKYNRSQMRELLGLRRHLSFQFTNKLPSHNDVAFRKETTFAEPNVQIIMFRSSPADFLEPETANLYDLHQIILK